MHIHRDESTDVIALSISLPDISLGHASIATSYRPSILYSSSYIATFREWFWFSGNRNTGITTEIKCCILQAVELRSVIERCWPLGVIRSWTIIARSKTRAKTGWNFSLIVRIWNTSYSFCRHRGWEKWTRKRKVFTGTRMRKEQVT